MSPAPRTSAAPAHAGPRRTALALALTTTLLLGVGGLVTTYRVGMAVHDWPTTFGYSMFSYPLDAMLENFGVTVEHTHRLLASLVGLGTIALLLAGARGAGRAAQLLTLAAVALEVALVARVLQSGAIDGAELPWLLAGVAALLAAGCAVGADRGRRALFAGAHLAVVGQGLLGGTRVLENSQHLAFLHGAAAQVVYALVATAVVVTSRAWAAARPRPLPGLRGVAPLAWGTAALVYGQIVLGAWLRHSGAGLPLMLHVGVAFLAVAAVLLLARRLSRAVAAGRAAGLELGPLAATRRWLLAATALQVLLGSGALVAILVLGEGFRGAVTVTEAVTATLHVATGAVLLASCVAAGLWSLRLAGAERGAFAGAPALEGGAA